MSDENRNYPPVPPAPPSPAPQDQTAATAQGGSTPTPTPPSPPTPTPPQNWEQPPPAPQQQQSNGQQTWQQTHEKLQQQAGGGAPTWEHIKASGNYRIPPEYPADKFNPDSFSVPALLLSWIWYMVKGMWQKGVVILVAGIIVFRVVPLVGFLLYIGIAVYAGVYGHRDYMRFHNSKQQFWF